MIDTMSLARAGLLKLSSALTLIGTFRNEKECMGSFCSDGNTLLTDVFRSRLVWYGRGTSHDRVDLVGISRDQEANE
jgi:hypothetical protein